MSTPQTMAVIAEQAADARQFILHLPRPIMTGKPFTVFHGQPVEMEQADRLDAQAYVAIMRLLDLPGMEWVMIERHALILNIGLMFTWKRLFNGLIPDALTAGFNLTTLELSTRSVTGHALEFNDDDADEADPRVLRAAFEASPSD